MSVTPTMPHVSTHLRALVGIRGAKDEGDEPRERVGSGIDDVHAPSVTHAHERRRGAYGGEQRVRVARHARVPQYRDVLEVGGGADELGEPQLRRYEGAQCGERDGRDGGEVRGLHGRMDLECV